MRLSTVAAVLTFTALSLVAACAVKSSSAPASRAVNDEATPQPLETSVAPTTTTVSRDISDKSEREVVAESLPPRAPSGCARPPRQPQPQARVIAYVFRRLGLVRLRGGQGALGARRLWWRRRPRGGAGWRITRSGAHARVPRGPLVSRRVDRGRRVGRQRELPRVSEVARDREVAPVSPGRREPPSLPRRTRRGGSCGPGVSCRGERRGGALGDVHDGAERSRAPVPHAPRGSTRGS